MHGTGKQIAEAAGPIRGVVRMVAGLLEGAWALVFGPPDLGAVDFATLARRRTPNDALVAPEGLCRQADVDRVAPAHRVPAERLRAILAEVALSERGTTRLAATGAQDRFLVRTPFFRFPDTVNAEAVPRGEGEAALALYSRSQIGGYDFGVNGARLARWLARVDERLKAERGSA
jgi:uncharacterized protein (DUF1499 family)